MFTCEHCKPLGGNSAEHGDRRIVLNLAGLPLVVPEDNIGISFLKSRFLQSGETLAYSGHLINAYPAELNKMA